MKYDPFYLIEIGPINDAVSGHRLLNNQLCPAVAAYNGVAGIILSYI